MSEDTARDISVIGEPRSLLSAIVELARDPAMDVEKLQALMAMQERMEVRQAEAEFNAALARVSSKIPHVPRNGRIPLPRKDGTVQNVPFSRWEDMDRIIRPFLSEEGFTLSFTTQPRPAEGGGLIITGTLRHRLGHSMEASMPLPLDTGPGRNNLQANGSTLAYGKRYCSEMLVNIVREGEDNDGAGGNDPIDAESVKRLNDLIMETKSNFDQFVKFMGVKGLPEILTKDYATAVNALLAKKAKVAT